MNQKEAKALIFNIDSLLSDRSDLQFLANKTLAKDLGVDLNEKDNLNYKNLNQEEVVIDLLKKANIVDPTKEEIDGMCERRSGYYRHYLESSAEKNELDGLELFLNEARSNGMKIAVASANRNVKNILKRVGLLEKFDYIADPENIEQQIVLPEDFFKAADKIKVPYHQCVAIDSNEIGLEVIHQTPMFSVAVGESLNGADIHLLAAKELEVGKIKKEFQQKKNYVVGVSLSGGKIKVVISNEKGEITTRKTIEANITEVEKIKEIIVKTLEKGGVGLKEVSAVVCGIANLDKEEKLKWAKKLTDIDGLRGVKVHVNHALIDGKASFEDGVGIIAKTGSIEGFNEKERRYLKYETKENYSQWIEELKRRRRGNESLIEDLLNGFGSGTLEELSNKVAIEMNKQNSEKVNAINSLDKMNEIFAKHAEKGNDFAAQIVDKATSELIRGIEKVAATFENQQIKLAAVSNLLKNRYTKKIFLEKLGKTEKKILFQDSVLEPEYGAVMMGFEKIKNPVISKQLRKHLEKGGIELE